MRAEFLNFFSVIARNLGDFALVSGDESITDICYTKNNA